MKNNIRYYRERMGLSGTQLADRVGVAQSHISGIELERVNPSMPVLADIAGVLGVTVSDLLAETPAQQQTKIAPEDSARAMGQAIAAIQRAFGEARKCSGDDLLIVKAFFRTCCELLEEAE